MSQLTVTVVRADTNAAYDVDLPADAVISEILAELVKEMGLPRTGPNGGDVISYELSNKRTGDWVRDGTLESKGIKSGDVLLLTSTFVAGGAPAPRFGVVCPLCKMRFAHRAALIMHGHWRH